MNCPSCKHDQHLHMKEKHRSWTSRERADCACTCGCGITREEIDAHYKKHPPAPKVAVPQIAVPGLAGGGNSTSKIKVFVAAGHVAGQELILGWDEPDGEIMSQESQVIGSSNPEDYELEECPGFGIWVFEGTVTVSWSRCGSPMEPPDYDSSFAWKGEWRPPHDEELSRWRGFKAAHTTYEEKEDGTITFQCDGSKDDPKLKPGWKVYCKLKRDHDGPHVFNDETVLDHIAEATTTGPTAQPENPERVWLSDTARAVMRGDPRTLLSDDPFCVCGKHVSECCCGEDNNPPHHPSGRAYDEEDYEQFDK